MIYFIYALGDPDCLVKIGYTDADFDRRLKMLQVGCPLTLCLIALAEGDRAHETYLHKRFAEDRRHGEWFYPSPSLRAYILGILGADFSRFIAEELESPTRLAAYATVLRCDVTTVRNDLQDLMADCAVARLRGT